jgi:hypothetical protein
MGRWMPHQRRRPPLKRSNAKLSMQAVPGMAEAPIAGSGVSLPTRTDACRSGDAEHPVWRPRPGEVLAGVIDRYTISDTPQGPVRTVIVTEEQTGEQVSMQLASTSLLALFAEQQPHPGARIDVRYRGHTPDHGYQRWRLCMDRRAPLEWSPLGGEASDEAPWHRQPHRVSAVVGLTPHPQEVV